MVTGYQLSKTIHEKDITRRDGNRGRGRMDTQQARGGQRVALALDRGGGRGRAILHVEEAAKNSPVSFASHAGANRQQIKIAFEHRREEMQMHRLLISPAMEVRARRFP